MKNLLSILLLSCYLIACSGDITDAVENQVKDEPKEYIVNLGLSGEIIHIEEQPLSRASTNDLYGVQVYSISADGKQRKPYAHGLFDNKEAMTIKLMEGYKYDFIISMVPDGKTKIRLYPDMGYSVPFATQSGFTKLSNSFIYSFDTSYMALNGGSADKAEGEFKMFSRPNIDRYHGELSGYIPTENGSVSFEMKRVAFGIKIIVIGLTEGELLASVEYAPQLSIIYPTSEISEIISFANSGNNAEWTSDDYTETAPVSFSWKKSDRTTTPLITQNITFKRNKQTIITVIVSDNTTSSGVDISKENTPMTDGEEITINTNGNTDTEVKPET